VRSGSLAATVIVPANAGLALEMLAKTVQSGALPADRTFTEVRSYPTIADLATSYGKKRLV
jgi:hypothetical protein